MKFIDLFANIGGFHQAFNRLVPKAKSVFVSEFNNSSDAEYLDDFGINAFNNWRNFFNLKNQELYLNNKDFVYEWKVKLAVYSSVENNAFDNFEWQVDASYSSLFDGLIKSRISGIREGKRSSINTLMEWGILRF